MTAIALLESLQQLNSKRGVNAYPDHFFHKTAFRNCCLTRHTAPRRYKQLCISAKLVLWKGQFSTKAETNFKNTGTPLRTHPFLQYCKRQYRTFINSAEFTTKGVALCPIHAQKGASWLVIVGWETNTFETHFQAKNYRNDPWKYSLNNSSKLKRHSILMRLSSQMVLRSWVLWALKFTWHFSAYIGAKSRKHIHNPLEAY